MLTDLLTLSGRDGAVLHLLASTVLPDGIEAEGFIADVALRAGRVFTAPDGRRYRLTAGVKPGVRWDEPVRLTGR